MVLYETPGLTSRVRGCAYRMPLCSVCLREHNGDHNRDGGGSLRGTN